MTGFHRGRAWSRDQVLVFIDHDSLHFFYHTASVPDSSQGSLLASIAAGFLNRILLVPGSRAVILDAKLSYLTTVWVCGCVLGLGWYLWSPVLTQPVVYLKSEHWNTIQCSSLSLCHLSPMSIYYSVHPPHPPISSYPWSTAQGTDMWEDYNCLSASRLG